MHIGTMMKRADQNKKGSDNIFLLINAYSLLIFRFRFVHNLDVKRINLDAYGSSNREHAGRVYQPFETIGLYLHFVVDTFKNKVGYFALNGSFFRRYEHNIFRTDDNVNRFVLTKAGIYTGKFGGKEGYEFVTYDSGMNNVTVTDKVSNKRILWFVINYLRSTNLLDITLVHNYDGIGHG